MRSRLPARPTRCARGMRNTSCCLRPASSECARRRRRPLPSAPAGALRPAGRPGIRRGDSLTAHRLAIAEPPVGVCTRARGLPRARPGLAMSHPTRGRPLAACARQRGLSGGLPRPTLLSGDCIAAEALLARALADYRAGQPARDCPGLALPHAWRSGAETWVRRAESGRLVKCLALRLASAKHPAQPLTPFRGADHRGAGGLGIGAAPTPCPHAYSGRRCAGAQTHESVLAWPGVRFTGAGGRGRRRACQCVVAA